MLKLLRKNPTVAIDIPGQDDVPPNERMRMVVRYVSLIEDDEIDAQRREASMLEDKHARRKGIAEALSRLIVQVEHNGEVLTVADTYDRLTGGEFTAMVIAALRVQHVSEDELGKPLSLPTS